MEEKIYTQIKSMKHEMVPVSGQQEINYDALFKVIIIGDTGVGKSCILARLMNNEFNDQHNVTIGVEFGNYVMRIDNQHIIQLQIWDTAGQESFRSIIRIFYKGSHAVILCYDICSQESYESAREWKKEIENNADRDVLVYLVGNRADLGDTEEREVTQQDGLDMMKEINLDHHMETSALTGHNIDELFELLTKHLYLENNNKLGEFRSDGQNDNELGGGRSISLGGSGRMNTNINLYDPKLKKKKKGCCKGQ